MRAKARVLKIRILKYDICRLSAQFQIDPFQVGLGRCFQQHAAHETRARKGQDVDVHVSGKGLARFRASASDHVQNTWRQPSV